VRGTQFGYVWLRIRKRKEYEERKSLEERVRPNQKDSVCIFSIFCTFIQVCADLEASVSSEAVTISCITNRSSASMLLCSFCCGG
jgi:hypothetical protein